MHRALILFMITLTAFSVSAAELVRDGQPLSEIVISDKPLTSVKTAADELQKYIKKMSGAELRIVNKPTGKIPVYVGKSEHTDKLGIKVEDIRYDGFKIIVKDEYVVLLGVDQQRLSIPRGNDKFGVHAAVQKSWEEYTGHKWAYPMNIRDPRLSNPGLGFSALDATGTLYAVYDFLESLGMRWFMPMEDIGVVVPELKNIKVSSCELKKEPQMASRFILLLYGENPAEFLWFKYLRQGGAFDQDAEHSSMNITSLQQERPELIAYSGGNPITVGKNTFLPRLSSPQLREELAEYLIKTSDAYPELTSMPIGQPDGWCMLDDRDLAAGWDKKDEGNWGRFSDYSWDFILDVASKVRKQRPDVKFNTMSYGYAKNPPKSIDRIPADIAIYFTQNSTMWQMPAVAGELALREEWFKKAPNSDFFIYDYSLYHSHINPGVPIPVVFTATLEKNFKSLPARCKGTYFEISYSYSPTRKYKDVITGFPGINHLMIYLHCKFAWDKNLDMKAVLQDYYEKFYGPAKSEMQEFFEYSETVWMRPDSRQISAFSGFLKPADVPKYFEILDRAKAKAGDSIYGKRIEFIAEEIAPLKKLFSELKRTGPYVRLRKMDIPSEVDGELTKPFWTNNYPGENVGLRDFATGVAPDINATAVAFRWLTDSSLLIGVTCYERRMDSIKATSPETARDDQSIYNDDNIEVHLETPEGYNAVIVVNPNGAVRDVCTTPNPADVAEAWNVEKVAVRKLADRWTVEIKVKGIGDMPTKSYPWGVNVFRQRLAGGEFEGYAISPTGTGGFLNAPTKMGNLYGP